MLIAGGREMDDARKFEELVQFRAPANLSEAIDTAAKQRCQSKSDYIRQSVVDRLRSDGVDLRFIAGRALVALFVLVLLASNVMAAGTLPGISMTQQFDSLGKPLNGGKLFLIQAGTTATPQNCYQDSGLSIAWPNPITLDSAGRIPQLFCADGSIKIRLTNAAGVQQLVQDNLLVVGPSGGGGGGGSVDPTTIIQTGQIIPMYGTGVLSGFVRANGRTIGSAASGATERANADTQALFVYLWAADANLAVSGGRGASAVADWSANKTITLPDFRGRVVAGLDDMGNSAAARLTSSYFGALATTLGATGGSESTTLTLAQLPTGITSSQSGGGSVSVSIGGGLSMPAITGGWSTLVAAIGSYQVPQFNGVQSIQNISSMTGAATGVTSTSNNTSGSAHRTVQPTLLATIYLKL